jgi:hypothetical protein
MSHENNPPPYETADRRFLSDAARQASYRRFLAEREEQIQRRVRLLRAYVEMTPARRKEVTEIAAELASYELNIDPPVVRGMTAEEIRKSPNKLGYALPSSNTISIRMNECPCTVAGVVAHETKHRQQMIEGRFIEILGRDESEADATRFENEFTKKFLAGVRCECRTRPVSFSHLLNR